MEKNERAARHDLLTCIGTIGVFLDLVEGGFDFATDEGKEVLDDARKALDALESKFKGTG